jgi:CubicO group peptidase (beta-lactamase class C family)
MKMITNNLGIAETINNAINQRAVYGVSYSLLGLEQNEQHYLGYQGTGSDKIAIRPDLEYDLASLTKVIGTSTRILQLFGIGKIKLTDTIGNFLTNLKHPELTIKDLLLHCSGLPADIADVSELNRAGLIERVKQADLIYPTGSQTVYSDLGFILLGWIIAAIDGDLADSLNEHIFKPLAMNQTGFKLANQPPANFVPTENLPQRGGIIRGQVHDQKAWLLDGQSGHAGLFSTLSDLSNFASMYLHYGIFNEQPILQPASFAILKKFYQNGRTLGWQRWSPEGMKIWHTGFTGTSIALDLDQKTGFVCLTNRIYPTRQNQAWLKWRKLAVGLFFEEPEMIVSSTITD